MKISVVAPAMRSRCLHVGGRFLARQRIEVVAAGDALRELPQVVAREHVAQFGLADQDDLQQLLRFGLEVGEQAHLLEHLGRQVLRLVDDQHHALALGMRLEQVAIEDVDQLLHAAHGVVGQQDAQLLADRQQELRRVHARVQDQRDLGVVRLLGQQRADDGGLAGADFAGELDEAAGLGDAIDQVRQRLGVATAEEQVARVRRDREGLLGQAVERKVHA